LSHAARPRQIGKIINSRMIALRYVMVQRHTISGSSQRRGLWACLSADLNLLKDGSGDGASLRECRVEICSGVEQVAQNIPGADDVLEPEIERGQPKPQDIRR